MSVDRSESGPNIRRSRWRRPLAAAAIFVGSIAATGAGSTHAAPLTDDGWTTSVTAPITVARGELLTLDIDVTAATSTAALVDVEIYSLNGNGRGWHQTLQQVWDARTFAAGQPTRLQVQLTVPDDEPTNVHWVKVGVFKPGWGMLYHWNDAATSFNVTETPETPEPTTTVPTTTAPTPTTVAPPTTQPAPTPTTTTTVAPTTTLSGTDDDHHGRADDDASGTDHRTGRLARRRVPGRDVVLGVVQRPDRVRRAVRSWVVG